MIRLLAGDCRTTLRSLAPNSVQACITSPPYFGLRDYGLSPLVWGGDVEHEHEWVNETIVSDLRTQGPGGAVFHGGHGHKGSWTAIRGACTCGAWLGSLGLEPTPELYLAHLVEVFREVRRVLRPDGTVWVNMGDSYAGSGPISQTLSDRGLTYSDKKPIPPPGYKPKDLMMMPARLAMALQADGWTLRSQIPWLKRNSMPESVTDRPATAVEYVFLLSKNPRYFWDADAVRQTNSAKSSFGGVYAADGKYTDVGNGHSGLNASGRVVEQNGRSLRNADFFFQTWQGLELDEQGEPLALIVNPAPYAGAHYATFPPKLVEPMIKASTSEKGQCPACGAPWVRVTQKPDFSQQPKRGVSKLEGELQSHGNGFLTSAGQAWQEWRNSNPDVHLGWRPTCAHMTERSVLCGACNGTGWIGDPPSEDELNAGPFDRIPRSSHTNGVRCADCTGSGRTLVRDAPEPVPQTVLDPFGGSGTVGVVADRYNRNAILCELSPNYGDQAVTRVTSEAPLFTELEVG